MNRPEAMSPSQESHSWQPVKMPPSSQHPSTNHSMGRILLLRCSSCHLDLNKTTHRLPIGSEWSKNQRHNRTRRMPWSSRIQTSLDQIYLVYQSEAVLTFCIKSWYNILYNDGFKLRDEWRLNCNKKVHGNVLSFSKWHNHSGPLFTKLFTLLYQSLYVLVHGRTVLLSTKACLVYYLCWTLLYTLKIQQHWDNALQ